MRSSLLTAALALALTTAAIPCARAGDLTVVELFTSQGCSSCPPADALLAELARKPGVLALSMHVDYWDYIGWKDPFASPAVTERQRDYTRHFGLGYVYTPQMVVQGRRQMTGSNRAAVLRAVDEETTAAALEVVLAGDGRTAAAILPARAEAPVSTLWAVAFDHAHTTRVERGENGGRTLGHSNVVRDLRRLGTWRGEAARMPLPMAEMAAGRDAVAVLVQADASGAILGAAVLDLRPRQP